MKNLLQISLIAIFAVSLFTSHAKAQDARYDSLVTSGIKQIYDIKLVEAEATFRKLITDYPNKPAGKFFIAMIDWWKILLDPDNESYDDMFFKKLEDVIDQCDQLLDKNPDNVDALFFKGGAIGFRGRLRAFRESWFKAADDGKEALPLVERAGQLDPKNVDVQLGYGIYNYYASVLPEKYPVLKPVMWFLPKGDKSKGLVQLGYVSRDGKYAKYEAQYFLMNIFYSYEDKPYEAEKYAHLLTTQFPDNPNFERWMGRIYAKEGRWNWASATFANVLKKSGKGLVGYTFPAVKREALYYVGLEYKQEGKLDSAKIYFQQCADISYKIDKDGESGFLVNTTLYLGNIYDSQNNRAKAIEYYKKVLDMKDFGNAQDLAKQYLKNPYKY
jgi:tetratricopeptide (TPR) repeat protein